MRAATCNLQPAAPPVATTHTQPALFDPLLVEEFHREQSGVVQYITLCLIWPYHNTKQVFYPFDSLRVIVPAPIFLCCSTCLTLIRLGVCVCVILLLSSPPPSFLHFPPQLYFPFCFLLSLFIRCSRPQPNTTTLLTHTHTRIVATFLCPDRNWRVFWVWTVENDTLASENFSVLKRNQHNSVYKSSEMNFLLWKSSFSAVKCLVENLLSERFSPEWVEAVWRTRPAWKSCKSPWLWLQTVFGCRRVGTEQWAD